MYLKRLELLGFKSFPDKTVVKLTSGVTSIVGPNGCGKTNILDAIRWVLGEQRVSLLRSSKMEEVIFNGTRDIKPLGMAEVTLVIQNNKGVLPTEYGEVQITRRLFRSGDSEYLLNKVPCRLKDITDLFMDTGVGAHIYSVIQQDMIESILSDRADDRRFLFEEASGISKYKHRKKAALRKLDATEGDLLRLKDIVSEVNTQVNSLNRQMKKAKRYQMFSQELKGWELYLGKTTIEKINNERKEFSGRHDQLTNDKIKYDTDIDGISASQEEERKKLIDLDHQLSEISNSIYEKSEEAHAIENDITIRLERRDNARKLIERNGLDIEAFGKRQEILTEQIGQMENEIVGLEDQLQNRKAEITEAEEALNSNDDTLLDKRHQREDINKRLLELEGELSAGRSNDSNLREQENDINSSMDVMKKKLDSISDEKNILLEKRSSLENELETIRAKLKQAHDEKEIAELEIEKHEKELDEIAGQLFELTAAHEAAEARKNLLHEMMAHYEGYGGGVVAAMAERGRWPGLMGTVAENLTPTEGYQEVIETALSDAAEFMLCRDHSTAEEIIGYLQHEKKGRAGFLISGGDSTETQPTRPEIGHAGFIGWANAFVEVSDEIKPLADLLLARTAVCQPENVMEILAELPPYFSAVTTDGRFFRNKKILSGGARVELSLLGRREKISDQEKVIEDLNANIGNLKDSKNKITALVGTLQSKIDTLFTEIETLDEVSEKTEKELTSCEFELRTAGNESSRIDTEQHDLATRREALRTRQYSLNLNHDQLAKEKDEVVGDLNELDTRIEQLQSESDGAESRLTKLQISQVELRSELQQLHSRINHTRELASEIDSNAEIKSNEISQAKIEIDSVAEKLIEFEKLLKQKFDERSELTESQSQYRQDHSTIQDRLDERENNIKSLRQGREQTTGDLHNLELRMAEMESEERSVRQKINDEYDLDIEDITAEPPNLELSPELRSERMQNLKERMKDFGAVNLLALEEYKTARERYVFLTTQIDDLLRARTTLQTTITKINQTARRMFLETFEKVRQNFKDVFAELFSGGEANIQLVNEDDPLESMIDISARPRGKKLLSITQMSGGERALTAISLLFAIYLVKPSPFCILDEIDAPLDDANIHRFLKIIKTFSDQTQFIIITHNKITMEAASILYGITMEQPGVSRLVSVRFSQSEDDDEVIDTSLSDDNADEETNLPRSIKDRMTSTVKTVTGEDSTD